MLKKIIMLLCTCCCLHGFKLGLENIPPHLKNSLIKQKKRIGIVTNQTGIDQKGQRNIDRLRKEGFNLVSIFVPEHGLTGNHGNGESIDNGRDPISKLPIISLYKGETSKNTCSPKDIQDIDIFMFDIQDSGMRHYTYISTLLKILERAVEHKKDVIVLDRPNPLGNVMEGPLVEPNQKSFISIAPIPVRHGMTIGEIAHFFNKFVLPQSTKLTVVPMEGYRRNQGLKSLPVMLSSGLRTKQGCYAYSFLGLVGEVRPFFIGLKTDKPFEVLMISNKYNVPVRYWHQLKRLFKKFNIDTKLSQLEHTEKQKMYTGLILNIKDINKVNGFQLFLEILELSQKYNLNLKFAPTFNLATGTDKVQKYLNKEYSKKDLITFINNDLRSFHHHAQPCYLYSPTPEIKYLS
jgi:uncharacterized protein YbbC (DUF1343 family)